MAEGNQLYIQSIILHSCCRVQVLRSLLADGKWIQLRKEIIYGETGIFQLYIVEFHRK